MSPPKYPRTPHLPFSPEQHNDDRVHPDASTFVGVEVVVTEKMDGGCTCIYQGDVYARSTGSPSGHPSFDYVKGTHAWRSISWPRERFPYGENLYAQHSIPYEALSDFFLLFAIRDRDVWREWDFVETFARENDLHTVPVLFRGVFRSVSEIERFMIRHSEDTSRHGGAIEGFCLRLAAPFHNDRFGWSTAKFVRKGHVQTSEHWSRTWVPNKKAS